MGIDSICIGAGLAAMATVGGVVGFLLVKDERRLRSKKVLTEKY